MAEVANLKQIYLRILRMSGHSVLETPSPLKLAEIKPTDNAMLCVIDGVVTQVNKTFDEQQNEIEELRATVARLEAKVQGG